MQVQLEDLSRLISSVSWQYLGHGSYNIAYVSDEEFTIDGYTSRWVMRTPNMNCTHLNNPERALAKWRLFNPEYPAIIVGTSLLLPYLGNIQADDKAIQEKILDIYLRERHIIADACGDGNFIMHNQKAVCIDFDLALRRGSFASDEYINARQSAYSLNKYLHDNLQFRNAGSASMILLLNYLERQLSVAQIKNEYINLEALIFLQYFYRDGLPITVSTMEFLSGIITLNVHASNVRTLALLTAIRVTPIIINDYSQELIIDFMHAELCNIANREQIANYLACSVDWILQQAPEKLNVVSQYGCNLLHTAICYDDVAVVKKLLAMPGVDVNTPINCSYNDATNTTECTNNLNGMTALDVAFHFNVSNNIISSLLSCANVNAPITISFLADSQHVIKLRSDLVDLHISIDFDNLYKTVFYVRRQLLRYAIGQIVCDQNDSNAIMELFRQHPSVVSWRLNNENDTFLHCAIDARQLDWVHALMQLPQWSYLIYIRNILSLTSLHKIILNDVESLKEYLPTYLCVDNKEKVAGLLHYAASLAKGKWCKFLLNNGINPQTLLINNHKSAEEYWSGQDFENPIKGLRMCLLACANKFITRGNSEQYDFFLNLIISYKHFFSWGLDSDGNNFMTLAFMQQNHDAILTIIESSNWLELYRSLNKKQNVLFFLAAQYNYIEYFAYLNHDITQTDRTLAVCLAARHGHAGYCELLLSDGIVDFSYIDRDGKNLFQVWNGDPAKNPLHSRLHMMAYKKPHVAIEIFPALHDKKAKFHELICNNHVETVLSFIKFIPELLNVVDQSGKTPLMLAVCIDSIDLVKCLINQGADINYQLQPVDAEQDIDCENFTALDFAIVNNAEDIGHYLSARGAVSYACPQLFTRKRSSPAVIDDECASKRLN